MSLTTSPDSCSLAIWSPERTNNPSDTSPKMKRCHLSVQGQSQKLSVPAQQGLMRIDILIIPYSACDKFSALTADCSVKNGTEWQACVCTTESFDAWNR
jgi:hypothetical protein